MPLCTICESDNHRASNCPKRPRWFDRALAIVAAVVIVVGWGAQALRWAK